MNPSILIIYLSDTLTVRYTPRGSGLEEEGGGGGEVIPLRRKGGGIYAGSLVVLA